MSSGIVLDHCGAICKDLRTGIARWHNLGFALTPETQQSVAASVGEAKMLATANACAMFKRGYLELIGITRPDRPNPWSHFLARFEGLHLLALRCDSADDFYRALATRADDFSPPVQRTRKLTQNDVTKELRFRSIHSNDAHYPEGRFIIIEHETPELVWQPQYLRHPNTAVALIEMTIACANIGASARRLRAITGVQPRARRDQAMCFTLDGGTRVVLQYADRLEAKFAHMPATLPACYGITIAFRDRTRAVSVMQGNGICVQFLTDGTPWLPPIETNGFVMQMVQA